MSCLEHRARQLHRFYTERSSTVMQPKSKWIRGLTPAEPFTQAAELALSQRLPVVWHYLPLAAKHHSDDTEHVHQLRVATRRAAAAVEIFTDSLPQRRAKWIARQLKSIRRAAGKARDMDVLAERLALEKTDDEQVFDEITLQRIRVQRPIVDCHQKLKAEGFSQRCQELVDRIKWRGKGAEPTLAKSSRHILKPIAKRFIRQANKNLADFDQLHQLRKDSKRLRYALELLIDANSADVEKSDLYIFIEQIQQKLGKINDHRAAHDCFQHLTRSAASKSLAHRLTDLAEEERDAMLIETDVFRNWFDREQLIGIETLLIKSR
jgi:CHAD domain-containing protein